MIYLSAQPDEVRFRWEIEVQHYNFEQNGIDLKNVYAVFGYRNIPSVELLQLKEKLKSNIILIEDTRNEPIIYTPSIKPHLLKKFYNVYSELIDTKCFYHDSDIIFTYKGLPKFEEMNQIWYMSDSMSYMNYDYIMTKGSDVLLDICETVGLSPSLLRKNNSITGGCQYVMFGTDYDFWDYVEQKSNEIFMLSYNDDYYKKQWSKISGKPDNEYHGLQWWCAEMWATTFTAWKKGFSTKISNELQFSWGVGNTHGEFDDVKIFHNAGVTSEYEHTAFNKNSYKNRVPYFDDFSYIPNNQNTEKYVEEIKRAGKFYGYLN